MNTFRGLDNENYYDDKNIINNDKQFRNKNKKLKNLQKKDISKLSEDEKTEHKSKIKILECSINEYLEINKKIKKKNNNKRNDNDNNVKEEKINEDFLNKEYNKNKSYWEQYEKKEKIRKENEKKEKERKEKEKKERRKERKKQEKKRKKQEKIMDEKRNIYEIINDLNLSDKIIIEDIKNLFNNYSKKLYRELSLKYHPDKYEGNDNYQKCINNIKDIYNS